LYRWPGDDYVDFIGMDSYNGTNSTALAINVKNLAELSREKKKPVGITETGIEGVRKGNAQEYPEYWTKEILNPIVGKDISMVVMWRNKYDPAHSGYHFYGPYIGHSSSSNFVEFYESTFTLFSRDLPKIYEMAEGVTVN
jgi:mannan endo-1,4-beta-mannosidase